MVASAPAGAVSIIYTTTVVAAPGGTGFGPYVLPGVTGISGSVADQGLLPVSTVTVDFNLNAANGPTVASFTALESPSTITPFMFNLAAGTYFVELLWAGTTPFNAGLVVLSGTPIGGLPILGTPLPGALVLFGSALAGAGLFMRRRRDDTQALNPAH
jgi:hypothetical protein